jgi:hypothetical protein
MPRRIVDESLTVIEEQVLISNGRDPISLTGPYEHLFIEGAQYVFDGNRVTAHFRIARNGIGRWRLHTIDPNLSLVVTPDLRIRKYRRTDRTCVVKMVRVFESVLDTVKPLDDALGICNRQAHRWIPTQVRLCKFPYIWSGCLVCGAEQVWFLIPASG